MMLSIALSPTHIFAGVLLATSALGSTFSKNFESQTRRFTLKSSDDFSVQQLNRVGCSDAKPINGDLRMIEVFASSEEELSTYLDMGYSIHSIENGRPFSQIYNRNVTGYDSPEELFQKFNNLTQEYSNIAQLIDLNELLNTAPTQEGRHIFAMKISDNVNKEESEPNILIVSNHHARELITPQLALDTAERLLTSYQVDPEITAIVNTYAIYIIWTLNPDGLNHVWKVDNYWRKTRKPNYDGSFGVDLNRNYPIGWNFSCGGSSVPSSETYKGQSPASEPETQTMIAFQKKFKFAKVLDFHSYAREVRAIYGDCASLPKTIDNYLLSIGDQFAKKITSYKLARSCCMGGDVAYAYHDHASLSFLLETGTAFQPPAETMRQELSRVWPGTKWFLGLPIALRGAVVDTFGKPIGNAKITVLDVDFQLDESISSHPTTGLYHIHLPVGNWALKVQASGYDDKIVTIDVQDGGVIVDLVLL